MKLSEHFTLEELIRTTQDVKNLPGPAEFEALSYLVVNLLEPLRVMFDNPILVNSGYRSVQVNKAIGGATNSQHTKGEAVDIDSFDNAKLFKLIKENFVFDQLIWERGNDIQPDWVHVSLVNERKTGRKNRLEVLKTIDGKKYFKI